MTTKVKIYIPIVELLLLKIEVYRYIQLQYTQHRIICDDESRRGVRERKTYIM